MYQVVAPAVEQLVVVALPVHVFHTRSAARRTRSTGQIAPRLQPGINESSRTKITFGLCTHGAVVNPAGAEFL